MLFVIGEAGIIVYTNDAGERLVKANDGKYYKAAEVNADGTTVAGATAVTNPVASLVNPDGTTTGGTTKLTTLLMVQLLLIVKRQSMVVNYLM